MKKNISNIDRAVRVLIAIVIAALYFTDRITGTPGIILLVAGGVFFATSLAGFCPLYGLLGISTCKTGKKAVV